MNARLTAVLALFLFACGSSDPRALIDEGATALNSGKYAEAAASYEKALAALGENKSDAQYKMAKLGHVQAGARLDAASAKTEFLSYAQGNSQVSDSDYSKVASKFGDAGKFAEAIEILEVAKKAYPESPHLEALVKELGDRAKQSGSNEALDKLKGLGYIGD